MLHVKDSELIYLKKKKRREQKKHKKKQVEQSKKILDKEIKKIEGKINHLMEN